MLISIPTPHFSKLANAESLITPGIYLLVLSGRVLDVLPKSGPRQLHRASSLSSRLAICTVSHRIHDESYAFRFTNSTLRINESSFLDFISTICKQAVTHLVYIYSTPQWSGTLFDPDFPRFAGLKNVKLWHADAILLPIGSLGQKDGGTSHRSVIIEAVKQFMSISVRHHSGDVDFVLRKHFGRAAVTLELTARDVMANPRVSRVSVQNHTRVSIS
jgi:hypothetical protein